MQSYENFLKVYLFFIRSQLDRSYVNKIDKEMEKNPKDDTRDLVEQVKSIHSLRSSLSHRIKIKLNNHHILTDLKNATGVVMYNQVPLHSTCIISGKKISSQNGILLMIDQHVPCTVQSIYKAALYNFWFLIHMPEEIGHEIKVWLSEQLWWTRGTLTSIENVITKIHSHNNQMFAKKTFVKLKNISRYIQNDLAAMPIN